MGTTRTRRVAGVVLVSVTALTGVGSADDALVKRATVKAGETVLVAGHKNWTRTCGPAVRPPITITAEPRGGTIEIKPGDFEIESVRRNNADTSCFGKVVPGYGIYYTARADFKGDDTFNYRVALGIDRQVDYDYVVRVKVR